MVSPLLIEIGIGALALAVLSFFFVPVWAVSAALALAGVVLTLYGFSAGRRDDDR